LTPEGEALLPIARRLLAQWENAEDEMKQRFALQLGKIAIASMPSLRRHYCQKRFVITRVLPKHSGGD